MRRCVLSGKPSVFLDSVKSTGVVACLLRRCARRNTMKPSTGRALLKIVLMISCCLQMAAGQAQPARRVLILNEVGTSYPLTNLVDEGIRRALANSPYRIEFYREYMDTVLFSDPNEQLSFRKFYVQKYKDHQPDVVITVGSSPLRFMAEEHRKAFAGVPTVFCFPNVPDDSGKLDTEFTGVEGDISAGTTVAVALQLFPSTQHVFVVGGVAPYDRRQQSLVRQQLQAYQSRLDVSYLTDLAAPALVERLKKLPNQTIVLLTALGKGPDGSTYTADQSGPMVVDASNAPVFSLVDRYLGHGEIGGDVSSAIKDGQIAGSMALTILNGRKPKDIPVVRTAAAYIFDWRALKRWGVKEKNLPSGSIILNRQPTVWETYEWYILGGICLIVIEAMLISRLMWQHKALRTTNQRLREQTAALQARENLLKIFVKNVPAGVAMLDRDMRYIQVSDRWCADYSLDRSRVLGHSHYEIFPDIPERWKQVHRRSLDGETLRSDEDRWDRESGVTTWIRWEVRPWRNTDGTPGGILIFVEDITRRKQVEEALSGMSRKLIESQEQERARIARELHDDINQRLALLAVELDQWIKGPSNGDVHNHVEEIKGRIVEISHDVQTLSHQLHSSKLEYLGLAATARSFCREVSQKHNVCVSFTENGVPRSLPEEISVCLFRVLQEALQNAVKYSGANHVEVSLFGSAGEVRLRIRDHGIGFEVDRLTRSQGLGLVSMRERVGLVNGTILINSRPRAGTEVIVHVPVDVGRSSEVKLGVA